jgi:hypothetical protein
MVMVTGGLVDPFKRWGNGRAIRKIFPELRPALYRIFKRPLHSFLFKYGSTKNLFGQLAAQLLGL